MFAVWQRSVTSALHTLATRRVQSAAWMGRGSSRVFVNLAGMGFAVRMVSAGSILPVPNNFLLIFYLRIKNTNILKMAVTFH